MTARRLSLILILAVASLGFDSIAAEDGVEFFEKRIRPILAEHCYECHSADAKKLKGKLRLDSPENILRGGNTGPAVLPGNPDKSLLITALKYTDPDLQMPPAQGENSRKLADNVIADFVHWVHAGAPMATAPVAKSDSKPQKQHWAFVPPTMPSL